jgi:hypothetical protein
MSVLDEHLSSSFEGESGAGNRGIFDHSSGGYPCTPRVVYAEQRFQNAASLDERYDWSFRETVSGKL